MKIQIISDVHLEFRTRFNPKPVIQKNADYIVFAGDIVTSPEAAYEYFSEVRKQTKASIIYVLGNHEFYGNQLPDVIDLYDRALDDIEDAYMIDKSSIFFANHNVRFVGSTGWTSYRNGEDQHACEMFMNDFRAIKAIDDFGQQRFIEPLQLRAEHTKCKEFFEKALIQQSGVYTIAVSHHAPTPKSIAPKYRTSNINGAFYEDLRDMIHRHKPHMWIHGHTHNMCTYTVGKTEIVCNPMGYPFEEANGFMDGMMIKLDKQGIRGM